jgi:hypothetical protein
VARHQVHVGRRRADVLGRDVGAAQLVDGAGRPAHARVPQLRVAVVEHHGLATAEVEARGGGLQRHRPREREHVLERFGQTARVRAQAHASQRRAEHGRVHGDDQLQPRLGVLPDHYALVVDSLRPLVHNGHVCLPYTQGTSMTSGRGE